ncbi:hypothetical protein EBR66_08505, partial [bacterium]|nr:hypothetical protein [bacterium]
DKQNLISMAYALGYRPKVTSTAIVNLDVYQQLPAVISASIASPDYRYSLFIEKEAKIKSATNSNVVFVTNDLVDFSFSSSADTTDISIYQINGTTKINNNSLIENNIRLQPLISENNNILAEFIDLTSVSTSIISESNNSHNLGSISKQWANAYINDLSVSNISVSRNIFIPDNTITETNLSLDLQIKVNTVSSGGIGPNSINSSHIIDGSILGTDISSATGSKIAVGTITSFNIAEGTILGTDISSATITGSKIAEGTITSFNIADGTILGTDISDATISGSKIAEGTITSFHIATGSILGTDISDATISGSKIAEGTITSFNIADGTILGTDISSATITGSKIAEGTVTSS